MTANTLSSSVSAVHAVAADAVPMGSTGSNTGTILRPLIPPLGVDLIDQRGVGDLIVAGLDVHDVLDGGGIEVGDSELDAGRGDPRADCSGLAPFAVPGPKRAKPVIAMRATTNDLSALRISYFLSERHLFRGPSSDATSSERDVASHRSGERDTQPSSACQLVAGVTHLRLKLRTGMTNSRNRTRC